MVCQSVLCLYNKDITDNVFMAALCSRCGHYIFALWFLLFFFPPLISAVTEWMSVILLHGVALVRI